MDRYSRTRYIVWDSSAMVSQICLAILRETSVAMSLLINGGAYETIYHNGAILFQRGHFEARVSIHNAAASGNVWHAVRITLRRYDASCFARR